MTSSRSGSYPLASFAAGSATAWPQVASLFVAVTSAAMAQALIVDRFDIGLVRYLDVPLAVVVVLSWARPADSAALALLAGLMVDALGWRLFGVHCLAFAVVGPTLAVAPRVLPIGSRGLLGSLWQATAAGVASTAAMVVIVAVADRGLAPGAIAAPLLTGLWTGPTALAVSALASRLGLSARM